MRRETKKAADDTPVGLMFCNRSHYKNVKRYDSESHDFIQFQ